MFGVGEGRAVGPPGGADRRRGPIVAVDVSPEQEALARAAGATDFVVASATTAREIRALTGGRGADAAVECVGRAVTIRTAWDSTRRGGRTTVVGIGGKDQQVSFHALEIFHWGRSLTGCVYGNADPAADLPMLAEHVRAAGSTCRPWSPTGSPWTASRRRSTTCSPAREARPGGLLTPPARPPARLPACPPARLPA